MEFQQFAQCFLQIMSQNPLQASIESMEQLLQENPMNYLQNLIQIIHNSEFSDKARINAIRTLTVPLHITPQNYFHQFRTGKTQYPELLQQIYEALRPFLGMDNEVGVTSRESLAYCMVVAVDLFILVILDILRNLDENSNILLYLQFITRACQVTRYSINSETLQELYNLMKAKSEPEIINEALKILSISLIRPTEQDYPIIMELFSNFHRSHPRQIAAIIYMVDMPELYQTILNLIYESPEYITYVGVLFRNDNVWDMIDFNRFIPHLLLCKSHLNEIDCQNVKYILSTIKFHFIDHYQNPEITDQEQLEQMATREILVIYANALNELIQSQTVENIVTAIETYKDCLIYSSKIMDELVPHEQFLSLIPFQENEKIYLEYIQLLSLLFCSKMIEMPDGFFEQICQQFLSDNDDFYYSGSEALRDIFATQDHEIQSAVWQFLTNAFEEYSDNIEMQNRILNQLNKISISLIHESALEACGQAFQLLQNLCQSTRENILISNAMGLLGNLIRRAGKDINGFVGDIMNLTMELLSTHEDDAVFILGAICKVFGKDGGEVIQTCLNLIMERLQSINNELNLRSLSGLTSVIVEQINDPNILVAIYELYIPFLCSKKELHYDSVEAINDVVYKLFDKIPQPIIESIPHLIESGFTITTRIGFSPFNKSSVSAILFTTEVFKYRLSKGMNIPFRLEYNQELRHIIRHKNIRSHTKRKVIESYLAFAEMLPPNQRDARTAKVIEEYFQSTQEPIM